MILVTFQNEDGTTITVASSVSVQRSPSSKDVMAASSTGKLPEPSASSIPVAPSAKISEEL